jgi:CRISPR-associated endonuclease Csn1
MTVHGSNYGVINIRYHQEARQAKDLKSKNGTFVNGEDYRPAITILHTQFNALVEGFDFKINILGEIEPINR